MPDDALTWLRDRIEERGAGAFERRTLAYALAPSMLRVVEAAEKSHDDRCPLFGHTDDSRRRRIDCSDDQCRNPDHTRYVECDWPWHDVQEALDAFHAALAVERDR